MFIGFWNTKYPVIRINFSVDIIEYKEIYNRIEEELEINCKKYGVLVNKEKDIISKFKKLIMELNEKYKKQVVVNR